MLNFWKGVRNLSLTFNYQWIVFSILSLSHLLMAMFFYVWGPLAPSLIADIHISIGQLGLITSVMYLAMIIFSVPAGFLVDYYGAKSILVIAVLLVGGAFLLLSIFPYFKVLFIAAAMGGSGYGMINQVTTKGIMYWFESDKRASVMGLKQTGVTIGGSLIAIYIPFASGIMDWTKAVFILSFVLFIMAFISLLFYKEKPYRDNPAPSPFKSPNVEKLHLKEILFHPVLIFLTMILALLAASQACFISFIVIYGKETLGLTRILSGGLLTIAMVAGTVTRIVIGLISDRGFKGDRVTPLAFLVLIGVLSTLSLTFLHAGSPIWLVFCVSAFLGVSLVGWNSLAITLIAEFVGSEQVGSVMGILFTFAWGGMVLGPPIFGYLAETVGYNAGWYMITVLTTISCIGLIFVRKKNILPINNIALQ